MLLLKDLREFAEQHVKQRPNLEIVLVLGEETEYSKNVRDVGNHDELMTLVLVMPTYDSRISDEDNAEFGNNLYFMVVKNTDARDQSHKIEIFQKTQIEILALLRIMINLHKMNSMDIDSKPELLPYKDHVCLFNDIDLNSFRVDSVNNYHGTNGWEVEFTTETSL